MFGGGGSLICFHRTGPWDVSISTGIPSSFICQARTWKLVLCRTIYYCASIPTKFISVDKPCLRTTLRQAGWEPIPGSIVAAERDVRAGIAVGQAAERSGTGGGRCGTRLSQ